MNQKNIFNVPDVLAEINGFTRQRAAGDSFWLGDFGEKISLFVTPTKLKMIFIFVLSVVLILFGRLFWLQIFRGADYALTAEGNRLRMNQLLAGRGIIYDRYQLPLVSNIPHYSLSFIPADLPKTPSEQALLAEELASFTGKDQQKILELFARADQRSFQPVSIIDDLAANQALIFAVRENSLSGVKLTVAPRRSYLSGYGLSHLLGYLGEINEQKLATLKDQGYRAGDYLGQSGLEAVYETALRGQNGEEQVEVDVHGKVKKNIARREPVNGQDLTLTIDLDLQKKLADSLAQAIITSHGSGGGVAVALDPRNGEVLALVSLPDFDNNFFSAGIEAEAYQRYLADQRHPLFNRAVSGTYPPGSTFKPIVALAALSEGIINEQTTFLSTGGLRIDKWFFPDWKVGGHGRVNVIGALANSVNTFFYYLGGGYDHFEGLGVATIKNYAARLNLGQVTGIDLPGEATGFLPDAQWKLAHKNETWYIGDTYHLSIGQGDLLVTPLQVALYTSFIANGGTLYRPHLVKTPTATPDDYLIKKNIINAATVDIVRRGLRATVTSGSARSLSALPVSTAGKTGTAQVAGDLPTHAWFTGFAPYDDPKIVITILIENGGEGSTYAVPVFRDVVDWYFHEER